MIPWVILPDQKLLLFSTDYMTDRKVCMANIYNLKLETIGVFKIDKPVIFFIE